MTESNELLPCPFCGGEGAYQTDTEEAEFSEEWIGCLECGATAALDVWSRRVPALALRTPSDGEVVACAQFLIERLDDFERGSLGDDIEDACRDFDGHVSPAIERLRSALTPGKE